MAGLVNVMDIDSERLWGPGVPENVHIINSRARYFSLNRNQSVTSISLEDILFREQHRLYIINQGFFLFINEYLFPGQEP